MDQDFKITFLFLFLVLAWVAIPLVPAWLTFKITPDQTLGLKGPLHGLTMRAGGAFAAYFIVFLSISLFVSGVGKRVIGHVLKTETWTVAGEIKAFDAEGKQIATPDLAQMQVRMSPEPHMVTSDRVRLRLPFNEAEVPVIYLEVPTWGGGRILLNDPSAFEVDELARNITLKEFVILREQPRAASGIGPSVHANN